MVYNLKEITGQIAKRDGLTNSNCNHALIDYRVKIN